MLAVLGVAWAAPVSVFGAMVGLLALPFGARVVWSDHALVFHAFPWGPGGAMALGTVILHTGDSLDAQVSTYAGDGQVRLGDHERAHVYQFLALGPLFVPLYFACGGISARNRFERAADRYALTGRGWWPWSRAEP